MRIEYIVVGIVMMMFVFAVIITMLSGVVPNLDVLWKLLGG